MIGQGSGSAVDSLVFNMALVSSGDPVDLTSDAADRVVVMSYRDGTQFVNDVDFTVAWIGANDSDNLLEPNELAEITADLSGQPRRPGLPSHNQPKRQGHRSAAASRRFGLELPPQGAAPATQRPNRPTEGRSLSAPAPRGRTAAEAHPTAPPPWRSLRRPPSSPLHAG